METSAKANENIDALFTSIAKSIMKRLDSSLINSDKRESPVVATPCKSQKQEGTISRFLNFFTSSPKKNKKKSKPDNNNPDESKNIVNVESIEIGEINTAIQNQSDKTEKLSNLITAIGEKNLIQLKKLLISI